MRIVVVSRSWPSEERSGVSLVASEHVKMLISAGHDISIIGSHSSILNEDLKVSNKYFVSSHGSGSLYSPAFVDRKQMASIFRAENPELIIVEAWQTALTDAAIDIGFSMSLPVLMISHGVSLHKHSNSMLDILKMIAWIPYRLRLPNKISKLSAITTLDCESSSVRFYDRQIALKLRIPIISLLNSPVNWLYNLNTYAERKSQVLVVGYYSPIKNQLRAIDLIPGLPEFLKFKFIGPKKGRYYKSCLKRISDLGLKSRVSFNEDSDTNIAEEISESLMVLSTSKTEVLPLILLEAMASGTPFVATSVGAVLSLRAGIIVDEINSQRLAILSLANDKNLWSRISAVGRREYKSRYTYESISSSLKLAINTAISNSKKFCG